MMELMIMKIKTVGNADELWASVLAQQKMPTLLRLGYIPENLWSGKIKNFVFDVTKLKEPYLDWLSVTTDFEWEIDNVVYKIDSKFTIKKSSLGNKERMFHDIHRETFRFWRNERKLNEFTFLQAVDPNNPTFFSGHFFITIKNLITGLLLEAYLKSSFEE